MTAAAKKRDIHLTSRSRPLKPDDFTNFDYIIGMDFENSKAIKQAAAHWQDDLNRSLPDNWQDKVSMHVGTALASHHSSLFSEPAVRQ